jgi:hypothetical protein
MDDDRTAFGTILLAAIKLSALQMRIGNIAMEAALAFGNSGLQDRDADAPSKSIGERQIDAAARVLRAKMIGGYELGFQGLLRANFSDDRIREMSKAALEAAALSDE